MSLHEPDAQKGRFATLLATFVAALIYKLTGRFSLEGGHYVFHDPFHQGEFFSLVPSLASVRHEPIGLSIHGALDFIPALLTGSLWGFDRHFLPTFAAYALLNVLAVMLLAKFLVDAATGSTRVRNWALLGACLTGIYAVGYRDVVLLGAMCLFQVLLGDSSASWSGRRLLLQTFFGLTVALGLHWSFDRGLAGALSLGAASLYLLGRDKSYAVALGVFVASLLVLPVVHGAFSLPGYIENLTVLVKTSHQWRYEPTMEVRTLIAFAWFVNLLGFAGYALSRWRDGSWRKHLAEAIALSMLAVFMLKAGTNRAEMEHVHFTLWVPCIFALRMSQVEFPLRRALTLAAWPAILLGLYLGVENKSYSPVVVPACMAALLAGDRTLGNRFRPERMALFASLVLAALVLVLLSSKKVGNYLWMSGLMHPQTNTQTAQEPMRWIADELQRTQASCIFDLSNNGIIHGLTGLPSCSRFTYPVYADASYENELIEAVTRQNPPAIVYSSTFWSYAPDGRSMKERFPRLDRVLLAKYPRESCHVGYCMRYQK